MPVLGCGEHGRPSQAWTPLQPQHRDLVPVGYTEPKLWTSYPPVLKLLLLAEAGLAVTIITVAGREKTPRVATVNRTAFQSLLRMDCPLSLPVTLALVSRRSRAMSLRFLCLVEMRIICTCLT
jgi:hypothetical protein